MVKYKCLNNDRYTFICEGREYDSTYYDSHGTIEELAAEYPQDWEKIEESTDEFKDIYQSLLDMQRAKDTKYGNSALKPLDIFAKHHNYGSRLDEKLARVKHSEELRKNDVADLIGGLVLICKDKGWTNFDDLID